MNERADNGDKRREPLSRHRIISCAVAIADREGIESLSMRRLATELGATPMALYNHVAGKDDLLNGVSSHLLGEIDLSAIDAADWAGSVKAGYADFRRVLLRHPNLMPVLQRKTEMSIDAMRPVEVALSLLRSAGFNPEQALHAHWTLAGFTMGHVQWQLTSPLLDDDDGEGFSDLMRAHALHHRAMLSPQEFPCLLEAVPALEDCDMEAAWEFGIDAIIAGFKSKLASQEQTLHT